MQLEKLVEKLERGDWQPAAALVYGEEDLGVGETVDRLLAAIEGGGATRITLEGKKLKAGSLGDEIAQMPLFTERRVVLLNGLASSADLMNDLIERVEGEPDLFLLIRHQGEVDRRLRWYKRISKTGAVFRLEAVKEREMPDRIRARARLLGLDIALDPAQALASRVGTDLMTARNELEKLGLYIFPRKKIDLNDVEAAVGRSRDTIIYEITEGIAGRNRARSLADLKDLLRQGIAAGAILSLLAREVRFLLQAKIVLREDRAVGSTLNNYRAFTSYFRDRMPEGVKERFGKGRGNLLRMHPYVVYLRLGQASRFGEAELAGLLSAFSRADRAVKSGAGTPESVLFSTVAAASSAGGRAS